MKTHFVVTAEGQLACGSNSYVAMATAGRDVCASCERRLDDIIYAAVQLAKTPGAAALAVGDKRMARTLKYLRSLDAPVDATRTPTPATRCCSTPSSATSCSSSPSFA